MQFRKSFYTILLISLSVLVLAKCIKPGEQYKDPRGVQFAGSAACVQCHQNIFDSYKQTAHYQTSHLVYDSILQQKYTIAFDTFSFPSETVLIEKKQHRFYQSLYRNGNLARTHSFDVVFGSGEKAETFAYWQENQLYQLPLSFFSEIPGWANSPGFPANRAHFDKAIVRRCFECHGSYIEKEVGQTGSLSVKENFNRSSIIYGIDCERCHGPAAMHVDHHLNNPSEKAGRYLIKWDVLSRQQKLDACAVCHSGNDLTTQKSTFFFQPGDTLSNFYFPEFGSSSTAPDVHGKQMQLLAGSACFKNSNTLDCTSCHSTHHNEKADGALFSQRCMNCHQPGGNQFCKMAKTIGPAIQQNCIDCHMPNQASKAISFQQTGQEHTTAYYLRTHKIGIYPTETVNFINQLKTTGTHLTEPTKGLKTQ